MITHISAVILHAAITYIILQEKELQTISLDQNSKTQVSALPSLDIPKELWKLVDYLFSFGLAKVICSNLCSSKSRPSYWEHNYSNLVIVTIFEVLYKNSIGTVDRASAKPPTMQRMAL